MTLKPSETGEWEIISSRVFKAPRERVFRMFRDPARLARWWGPKGFTNTFHHFDLRPGGTWRFVMHGPDGKDYENEKHFIEVVEPERVVFDHPGPMHVFRMTMEFREAAAGTELVWKMAFQSDGKNPNLKAFIAKANEENFDRLEHCLDEMEEAS